MVSLEPALYVVATPIGNLGDLSPRAQEVLAQVALIAAEDTRHTRQLLGHFSISTPLLALHDHNEREQSMRVLDRLRKGAAVALVSDAGTPLVSDPGFRLVRGARDNGVTVRVIPGPCSAIAALSIAGLPSDRFAFEGFLPNKANARQRRLRALTDYSYSLIFFVPTRQVAEVLDDMILAFGATREALMARELTKRFEESRRASLAALRADLPDTPRGEFVFVVAPAPEPVDDQVPPEVERVLVRLLAELPLKRAVAVTADLTGAARNGLYQRALQINERRDE